MSKVYKIKEIRRDAKWAYRKEQLKQNYVRLVFGFITIRRWLLVLPLG